MAGARDAVRKGVQQYLELGETVQVSFYAMTGRFEYCDLAIAATDRRYLVCSINFNGRVNGHLVDVPRDTQIGPAKGIIQYWTRAFGPPVGIARRFFKDVEKADAMRPHRET